MSRKTVKVMTYSYFLKLKSYINTYISVTYTEYTVSNTLPKGNHNAGDVLEKTINTVSNTLPKGNHNSCHLFSANHPTVSNTLPKGNHNMR